MKKTIFAFLLISVLFSCKKETSTPIINPNDVTISGFDCAGVAINGKLQKDQVASNVSVTITYSGGNGKTYLTKSHTSTGVTGLSATLLAGTLANGEGVLTYSISGTPISVGIASFVISLGGKNCTITVTVDDIAQTIGKPGPNITDNEGNTYKTVTIGNQTWMAENLKVSKYSDGTLIPNITNDSDWSNLKTGAWSYCGNDAANNFKYGKLYNWYVVSEKTNGNKNVCPTGWHVPSDTEWTLLIEYLGGDSVAGVKMQAVGTTGYGWKNASNTSLFTGLPGGVRIGGQNFCGFSGHWLSSTAANTDNAWSLSIGGGDGVSKNEYSKGHGMSIRCLRD